jgi:hypothetical protein
MPAGRNAVSGGKYLEDYLALVMKRYEFDVMSYQTYEFTEPGGRVLVRQYPYINLAGGRRCRMDAAVVIDRELKCFIEMKHQDGAGSAANKLIFAYLNMRHASKAPENIIVVGGVTMTTPSQSVDYLMGKYAKEMARRGMALCENVNGVFKIVSELSSVKVMTRDQFEAWARKKYHRPKRMK